MKKKIRIFLVEDERFHLVKPVIDGLLGEDNYDVSFACCMTSGVYYLNKCESEDMAFDLLLFDVKLIEKAFKGSAYVNDFYKYSGKTINECDVYSAFEADMDGIDLTRFRSKAQTVLEPKGSFWKNGGLLLWAEFLRLFNCRGWPFRSLIFTGYSEIIEQYKFLEKTGITKTTDKLLRGRSEMMSGQSHHVVDPVYENYQYYLKRDYYTHFIDQLRDDMSVPRFEQLKSAKRIQIILPDNKKKELSFKNLPQNACELKKVLEVDSLDHVLLEYTPHTDAGTFCFSFFKTSDKEKEVPVTSDEVFGAVWEYIKEIQLEKKEKDVLIIGPEFIDELIRFPLKINENTDIDLQEPADCWTFKTLFCYQWQEIQNILKGTDPDREKEEKIRKIFFDIKQDFCRQDLAKVFGKFFKKGGTERLTHIEDYDSSVMNANYLSYDGDTLKSGQHVYQDSIKKLREIIRGLPDTDKRLIWDDGFEKELLTVISEIEAAKYRKWLLGLGAGGDACSKDSLLRLDEKKKYLLDAIPSDHNGININKQCDDDNTTVFLPKAMFKGVLNSILVETIQQARKVGSTCLDINIEFTKTNSKLFISIGHNGTKGYFQSNNVENKKSDDLESKDIDKLLSVKCLKAMLGFRNWFDFYLITKCKDNEFAIIDVFKKKKLSEQEVPVKLSKGFSNYYVFGVSKAPVTLRPVEKW